MRFKLIGDSEAIDSCEPVFFNVAAAKLMMNAWLAPRLNDYNKAASGPALAFRTKTGAFWGLSWFSIAYYAMPGFLNLKVECYPTIKGLSKLGHRLLLTKDIHKLLLRQQKAVINKLQNRCISDHKEAMSYRGVWELTGRDIIKEGQHQGLNFLTYQAEFNNSTIDQVMAEWVKKSTVRGVE